MATEIQYKVFKEVFDEEQARYSHLATRASVYLTIITFYVGVVFFKFNELSNFAKEFKISPIWFLLVGLLLIIALLLVVLAISIRTYEGIFDPQKIINSFGKTPPKDEDFLDERIVDLSVA